MQSARGFRIPIKQWSATDYAYLVNEQLGWVDAAQENYCFATEEEMGRFKA